MVAPVPIQSSPPSELQRLPLPDPLPNGSEPEARVVVSGLSWNSYLEFDKQLGEDQPGPRFYYLDGELEIVTTSREHERIKEWIGGMVDYYCDSANRLEIYSFSRAGDYERTEKSQVLAGFDVALLERCLAVPTWPEARKTFRAGLAPK